MSKDKKITLNQIGIIYSPFNEPKGVPIQPTSAMEIRGVVEIFPRYADGLKDLEGFSHIILIYYFHLVKEPKLLVKPFMDDKFHGVFSTRAPSRPNPIGLSIVYLEGIKKNKLFIKGVDIVNGTPLIDIKPYVPDFDERKCVRIGWLERNVKKLPETKDDGRFYK